MHSRPQPEMPAHEAVVTELKLIRRKGITRMGRLDLPALRQAAVVSGQVQEEERAGPYVIERLLRTALADIGGGAIEDGGPIANAGAVVFGLMPGTRGKTPKQLREEAKDFFGIGFNRFRDHYEGIIIDEMTQQILGRCHDHELRLAARAMEQRLPIASRLAVDWLDRFRAYYAMWSPIIGTAVSIAAYRSTLLEADRPYDRPPTAEEPEGYTQELQAQRYGWEALFFFAEYLAQLRRFQIKFGGLWLLSSKATECEVADAAYLVRYRTPFTEQEQSFLECKYGEAAEQLHTFSRLKAEDPHFIGLHESWQRFLDTCTCTWDAGQPPERGLFHTDRTVATINEDCQPHQVISAANNYCTIIDSEWDLIADWYHDSEPRPTLVDSAVLYTQLREQQRAGSNEWPPWGSPKP